MTSKRKLLIAIVVALACILSVALVACNNGTVKLKSIEVECSKTEYVEGDFFDKTSVTVNAVYSDDSKTSVADWSVDVETALTTDITKVTISYTEDGITVTKDINITVTEFPHDHTYGDESNPESWSSNGTQHWLECSCGHKDKIADHAYSPKTEVTKDVSCTEDGEEVKTCTVCGYVKTETITKLGHNFTEPHIDGSNHYYKCSRCEETTTPEEHDYELILTDMRTEWYVDETFAFVDGTALLVCECGSEVSISNAQLVPSKTQLSEDDTEIGCTCSYGGKQYTATLNITVSMRAIVGIAMADGYQQNYELNATLAETYISVTYEGDVVRDVLVTLDMLDGFDTSSYGSKEVTVSYEEQTCSYIIRVGYDEKTGAFRLGEEETTYKIQVENPDYVDMSGAQLQSGASNKFEDVAKDSENQTYPNGAEGMSTSNISVAGNKIVVRFFSEQAGKFTLGLRGQSGSNKGLDNQDIAKAFAVKVNGTNVTISGTLQAASSTSTAWCDMTIWTMLEDIAGELDLVVGLNEIEFSFLGGTMQTLRFPNIDYFTLNISEFIEPQAYTLTLDGGTFADGGGTTKQLYYGDTIPAINWTKENIIGYDYGGKLYTDITGFTMIGRDVTLKAISRSEATVTKLTNSVRYNQGANDNLGKTTQVSGTPNLSAGVSAGIYSDDDAMKYALSNIMDGARGITFRANVMFGSGDVLLILVIKNNGSEAMKDVSYGTEFGIVTIGDVEGGQTIETIAILNSDGANHWHNLFWGEQYSELDFSIALYTYQV